MQCFLASKVFLVGVSARSLIANILTPQKVQLLLTFWRHCMFATNTHKSGATNHYLHKILVTAKTLLLPSPSQLKNIEF